MKSKGTRKTAFLRVTRRAGHPLRGSERQYRQSEGDVPGNAVVAFDQGNPPEPARASRVTLTSIKCNPLMDFDQVAAVAPFRPDEPPHESGGVSPKGPFYLAGEAETRRFGRRLTAIGHKTEQ